ncbi:hypothetical protein K493DRAFT_298399 [Basidiobolus meristosporus CBS 931.73]|uniref:Na+/solute symporter n=1 Tax=Basidiobolus meristosporus CBS 931.73 TaxID=1314790 RepID=A0A1Y1YV03_9FUNG|nr:hypothetical protein K493DRAFT_298399 [Basidiobolus meristosporus CBS 931.73]|eukprot:ORY01395.1 hypothetical protein K493DRAFT_298399 [Basidiobolus meristosporus CBS 931.73]
MSTLSIAAYTTSVIVCVLFGAFALYLSKKLQHRNADTEFFLTARSSSNCTKITWSFYAASVGAWTLFGPPSYALTAGIIGVASYAVATGIPIFIVAFFGNKIQARYPNVVSLSDFVHWRFGPTLQYFVAFIMLFNMATALIAEYTSIGDLFESIIGASRIPYVIMVGVITMAYTATGGLYVSIVTDQGQAVMSILFVVIMIIYIAVTFRLPLRTPLPEALGPNYYGWGSIATMPISLFAGTCFSEAMWQRVWASEDPRALKKGALLAMLITTLVIFFLGFCGFLAAWGGLDTSNANVVLFTLLGHGGDAPVWITVIVTMLAVCMNTSAVDSMQNALVDSISSVFLKTRPVWWSRVLVVVVNVPLIILSLKGYQVMNLFLLSNLVTTCFILPVFMGLWEGRGRHMVNTASVLIGCMSGFGSVMVYGTLVKGNLRDGMYYTFFAGYTYPPFLLALGFSGVGLVISGFLISLVFPDYGKRPKIVEHAVETSKLSKIDQQLYE